MSQQTTRPTITEQIAVARPPHRLERLRDWMQEHELDAVVVAGPDKVNYVAGYWRYYGGPRRGRRRPGSRANARRHARRGPGGRASRCSRACRGFGVRGFGIELDPMPMLADAAASQPPGLGTPRRHRRRPRCDARPARRRDSRAELVGRRGELASSGCCKDEDELVQHPARVRALLARAAGRRRGRGRGATEIEMFTAAQSTAQVAHGEPIEFLADLLSGADTARCAARSGSPDGRRVEPGEPVIADVVVRANGYWGDTRGDAYRRRERRGRGRPGDAARDPRAGRPRARPRRHRRRRSSGRWPIASPRPFPGGEFPHHGGHALGLTSFEDPHMIPADETPLESWMVIAVEPGVYFPQPVGRESRERLRRHAGGGHRASRRDGSMRVADATALASHGLHRLGPRSLGRRSTATCSGSRS